jgi:hypothetical protein
LPDAVSQAKSAIGLLTQALWLRHQAGLPLLQQLTPAQPAAGLRVGVGVAAFF